MKCNHATKLMSQAQDIKLDLKSDVLLKIHFAFCPACRHFNQHLAVLRQAMQLYAKGEQEETNFINQK